MNYNELIQLYFERSTAMQAYWNLYVVIVGGLLAFSSLRKQPAAITTLIVSILFALFAYRCHDGPERKPERSVTSNMFRKVFSRGNEGVLPRNR